MPRKTFVIEEGWQLFQEPNVIFYSSFFSTKKEAIKCAEECYGRSWKVSQGLGYKVVKAKIVIEL